MFILCMLERSFHTNTDENKYKTYEHFKTGNHFNSTITDGKHLNDFDATRNSEKKITQSYPKYFNF